jgi:Na+-driven multidrug efflux pump
MGAQNLGFFGTAGLWIWLALCAALFLVYPIVQKPTDKSLLRCLLFFVRVVVVFAVALGFGVLFDYWLRPRDLSELPMMISLFGIPALAAGVLAFIIGCTVRMARIST